MAQRKIIHKIIGRFSAYGVFNGLKDEKYIKLIYWARMGKKLNLKSPQTFNEKLQWLKLYDRKSIYTTMVDKYEAKKYVASVIGEEYIIPTLGVWEHFEDIDFNVLPDQFVLKCTHDSGGLAICKDKKNFDFEAAKKKINKSLKKNYYLSGREWPYKNVKPRIIAEKYMQQENRQDLKDYKFFCFGGEVKCFKVDFDRFIEHHANYYDADANLLDLGESICPPDFSKQLDIDKKVLDEMEILAEKLAQGTAFLRTDFYDIDGKVYFGELTFYPAAGFGSFLSDTSDELLGKWIPISGGDYSEQKNLL